MVQYKQGKKAYLDTLRGLVPCRVSEVVAEGGGRTVNSGSLIVVILQNNVSGWAGMVGMSWTASADRVVPCDKIYRNKIDTNYQWVK